LCNKIEHSRNLVPRNVELFHNFFDAQILQVLYDRGNRQPIASEYPRAADLSGDTLHGRAL